MRMARRFTIIAMGCFAVGAAEAQVDCTTSNKLVCLVPFITSIGTINSSGAPTTTSPSGAQLFNGPIAAQLSQLPLAASAPGATILTVNGNPEAFDNLGPILLDRPDSVGKGKIVVGFSFQQYHFNHIDGVSIGSIPIAYSVSAQGTYPTQYLQSTEQVSLKFNQYVMLATYGLPRKTDVSVIVPYARISISAGSPSTTFYDISSTNSLGPVSVDNTAKNSSGVASGLGDVTINLKHVLWSGGESGRGSLATGFALRLPTGDALNYLGSGAYGYNIYGLASYKARVSPHVKYGYQWNSTSVLLNPSGTGANQSLPGGSAFGVGADTALSRRITASGDILANQFVNSPYISLGSITIPNGTVINPPGTTANPTPTTTLATIVSTTKTYTTANASLGLKWKPLKDVILYGNVLIQMNNVGLRSYPSPSGGISYSFRP